MSEVDKGRIEQYLKSAFGEEFNPKEFAEKGMASIIPGWVDYEVEGEGKKLALVGKLPPRHLMIKGKKKTFDPLLGLILASSSSIYDLVVNPNKKNLAGSFVVIPCLDFSREITTRIAEAISSQKGIKYVSLTGRDSSINISAITSSNEALTPKFINTFYEGFLAAVQLFAPQDGKSKLEEVIEKATEMLERTIFTSQDLEYNGIMLNNESDAPTFDLSFRIRGVLTKEGESPVSYHGAVPIENKGYLLFKNPLNVVVKTTKVPDEKDKDFGYEIHLPDALKLTFYVPKSEQHSFERI